MRLFTIISGHTLGESYPSADMQLMYSTAPTDWPFSIGFYSEIFFHFILFNSAFHSLILKKNNKTKNKTKKNSILDRLSVIAKLKKYSFWNFLFLSKMLAYRQKCWQRKRRHEATLQSSRFRSPHGSEALTAGIRID